LSHSVPVAAITISIVGKLLIVLNFIFDWLFERFTEGNFFPKPKNSEPYPKV
jgi:hypothetical protein